MKGKSRMIFNLECFPEPTFSFHFKETNTRNHRQCFQGIIYRKKISNPYSETDPNKKTKINVLS